jgi:hypothetical protein
MRKKVLVPLLITLFIIIYLMNYYPIRREEVSDMQMWVRHDMDINSTTETEEINRVIDILNNFEWQDDALKNEKENDYAFWISKAPHEERLVNCDLWIEDNSILLMDVRSRKHVVSERKDMMELVSILESLTD